jgi:hypothetical protein
MLRMAMTQSRQSSHIGMLTSTTAAVAIQKERLRVPTKMNGRTLGLMAISAAGQPQRNPAATAATSHMSVLPHRNAPKARTHIINAIIRAIAQKFGRQLAMTYARTTIGVSHQRNAGKTRNGTKSSNAIGG